MGHLPSGCSTGHPVCTTRAMVQAQRGQDQAACMIVWVYVCPWNLDPITPSIRDFPWLPLLNGSGSMGIEAMGSPLQTYLDLSVPSYAV